MAKKYQQSEVKLSPEDEAYFNTPGCTCRMVPFPDLDIVLICGKKNCPVHAVEVVPEDKKEQLSDD